MVRYTRERNLHGIRTLRGRRRLRVVVVVVVMLRLLSLDNAG